MRDTTKVQVVLDYDVVENKKAGTRSFRLTDVTYTGAAMGPGLVQIQMDLRRGSTRRLITKAFQAMGERLRPKQKRKEEVAKKKSEEAKEETPVKAEEPQTEEPKTKEEPTKKKGGFFGKSKKGEA